MASACVNNIGMSPDNFSPAPYPSSYGWLNPRASFSREFPENDYPKPIAFAMPPLQEEKAFPDPPADSESSTGDFEFCLENPVAMLPADELFADGKLVPLQLSAMKTKTQTSTEIQSPDRGDSRRRSDISGMDLYMLSSPKAPRCSSRWKELLGLKKLSQNASTKNGESTATTRKAAAGAASSSSSSTNSRSIRHFLHRSSKSSSSSDSSLNLPLLKDLDSDSVLVSSRHSLSSSSSGGHEHEDLPRLSLDSEKPHSLSLHKNPSIANPPRMRLVKSRAENPRPLVDNPGPNRAEKSPVRRTPVESGGGVTPRGISIDSPRMNASGKVIFQSLERSSSSPSTFNGGPRHKHRGVERSYSAGVRVAPVLNVPVSSLMGSSKSGSVFGFGPLFSSSPQKRDGGGNAGGGGSSRNYQQLNSRNVRT